MKSEKIPFIKKVKLRRRYQWLAKGAQIDLIDHKFELHIWWYNSDHLRTIIRAADYTCPMRNLWAFRESEQGPVTIYYFCEEQKRLCLVAYECDEWVIWRKYVFFRKGRYWNLFKIDSLQYLYLGLWKNGFWCSNSIYSEKICWLHIFCLEMNYIAKFIGIRRNIGYKKNLLLSGLMACGIIC